MPFEIEMCEHCGIALADCVYHRDQPKSDETRKSRLYRATDQDWSIEYSGPSARGIAAAIFHFADEITAVEVLAEGARVVAKVSPPEFFAQHAANIRQRMGVLMPLGLDLSLVAGCALESPPITFPAAPWGESMAAELGRRAHRAAEEMLRDCLTRPDTVEVRPASPPPYPAVNPTAPPRFERPVEVDYLGECEKCGKDCLTNQAVSRSTIQRPVYRDSSGPRPVGWTAGRITYAHASCPSDIDPRSRGK